MLESYANPQKTREVLQFGPKKNLRFEFEVFGGCGQGWGMFCLFWFFFYDIIAQTMSRNCGKSLFGSKAVIRVFRAVDRLLGVSGAKVMAKRPKSFKITLGK